MLRRLPARSLTALSLVAAVSLLAARAAAAQHDMSRMGAETPVSPLALGIPLSRLGSGTSWMPDSSPMYAVGWSPGAWTLMAHGAAFGQLDRQMGFRGDDQIGIADHEMLMALRPGGGGDLRLTATTSLEPLVIGPRGYPELLQTGGVYRGARLVNRQHPSDLVMEVSAAYEHTLIDGLAASIYGGPVGEPALGPVAYMHRPSAAVDPFAPLGHHWQDASHAALGVVTAGLFSRAIKLEASAFNGREHPLSRLGLDYSGARLDSYSARITAMPLPTVAVAAWGGYIYGHDPLEPQTGMQRYGASVMTSTRGIGGGTWSTSAVWGLNIHHHGPREHDHGTAVPKLYHVSGSLLLESNLDLTERTSVYARAEQVQKSADELGFLGGDDMQLFTIRALTLGAGHDVARFGSASVSLGARATANFLPATLHLTYQGNTPTGFAVYVRVRPARMRM